MKYLESPERRSNLSTNISSDKPQSRDYVTVKGRPVLSHLEFIRVSLSSTAQWCDMLLQLRLRSSNTCDAGKAGTGYSS